jgi:hypothetical protein
LFQKLQMLLPESQVNCSLHAYVISRLNRHQKELHDR